MRRPVVLFGAGGHGRVLLDVLRLLDASVLGVADDDQARLGTEWFGVPVLGGADAVPTHDADIVNGVGSATLPRARTAVFERFSAIGCTWRTLVHPRAVVAQDVELGPGSQVMAGAIVQPGTVVGADAILNTGCRVDHDCRIGDHVHVAPGATLSGSVEVGDGCMVGAGTTVIQGVRIGARSLIAAGSVVYRDVPADATFIQRRRA